MKNVAYVKAVFQSVRLGFKEELSGSVSRVDSDILALEDHGEREGERGIRYGEDGAGVGWKGGTTCVSEMKASLGMQEEARG